MQRVLSITTTGEGNKHMMVCEDLQETGEKKETSD